MSLRDLVRRGLIDKMEALHYARDPEKLKLDMV
jgi:hypothetical protein